MIRYECDKCQTTLGPNDQHRFVVKIEVYAAAGPVELDLDSGRDDRAELGALVERLRSADADEVEDQTYRCLRFDLCDACRRDMLKNPLGRAGSSCG